MARREMTPDDLPLPAHQSIDLANPQAYVPEPIVPVDGPLEDDYVKALRFNEEELVVRLEVSDTVGDEGQKVLAYPVTVNGQTRWLRPGQEETIKRKFVEALLVAQPLKISTEVIKEQGREFNLIHRSASRRFPVSIIRDPNPMGAEWARRTVLQAG